MDLPILPGLLEKQKFDFLTLAEHVEECDAFWEDWCNDCDPAMISRPETIEDQDPILEETLDKPTVNLGQFPEFFDSPLRNTIQDYPIPLKRMSREGYQEKLLCVLARSSIILRDQPQIVFAGGGYGSGKSYSLNHLAEIEAIPFKIGNMVGVDVFKMLIPEYNLIKAVADGRASVTVQRECQQLANELFERLTANERSFMWDSSMSNKAESLERIAMARNAGYGLTMIAVLTPVEIAIRQAMKRAHATRRFPNIKALPDSHRGFREAFNDYVPLFDKVIVFGKFEAGPGPCYVLADKTERLNPLAMIDEELFIRGLSH